MYKIRKRFKLPDLTVPFKDELQVNGDMMRLTYAQNVGDIYRHNYEMQKNSDENWARSKEFKHVACIPILELVKLEKMGIMPGTVEYLRAIQSHPEWMVTRKRII